jgi:CDP-4-dehydro-6-deoxyglucose reductase, E1
MKYNRNKYTLLPLATSTWDREEIDAAVNVLESQQTTSGKLVDEFEKRFANFVGSKYCVMVNSGSSANLLAITAAKFHNKTKDILNRNDVVVPAVSWGTSYFPWYQNNIRLSIADVNEATLNLDVERLAKNEKTNNINLIMPVHILGNPVDMYKLLSLIKYPEGKSDTVIIEDCCEALGATIKGKHVGTFGLAGTFSFFFSHHISTMEGGAVVTDDELFYSIMKSIRSHGWIRDIDKFKSLPIDEFMGKYTFLYPGYNMRATEVQAAIGIEQLNKIGHFISIRNTNANYFHDIIHSGKYRRFEENIIYQHVDEHSTSSWFGFSMIIKNRKNRNSNELRNKIVNNLESVGISSRPIVSGNILRQPVIFHMPFTIFNDLINAEIIHNNGFYIANMHKKIGYELKIAIECIERTLRNEG